MFDRKQRLIVNDVLSIKRLLNILFRIKMDEVATGFMPIHKIRTLFF